MRTPTAVSASLLAAALALAACSADQQAPMAPSTTLSSFVASKGYSLSLDCVNAGSETQATVTFSPSGTNAPLTCVGGIGTSGFRSINFRIHLTDSNNQPVLDCENNKPIRRPGSFTCSNQAGTISATLTVTQQ